MAPPDPIANAELSELVRPPRQEDPAVGDGVKIVRACTIRRPALELYAFWRQPENLALVIRHPATITADAPDLSHWQITAKPGDQPVEWDAEIINDEPDRLIAWRTRAGSGVAHAGTVRFEPAPGDEGTEVRVALEYEPPAGVVGAKVAALLPADPARQVADALRRFKALMETGEIPTTAGQPHGSTRRGRAKR